MVDIHHIGKILVVLLVVFLSLTTPSQVSSIGQLQIPDVQLTTVVVPVGPNFPIALDTGRDSVKGKPGIGFDGVNFLVPYITQSNDIYARRVNQQGLLLDSQAISISVGLNQSAYPPSVGFDGENYVVVWSATRAGVNELYCARVTPAGIVLDPGGIQITSGGNPKIRMPGIAFDGTNYLVVWRTNEDNIYAARISPSLVNLDAPAGFPITTNRSSYYPSVAFDGTNHLVVWHDGRGSSGGWSIYGARVTPQGNVLDPDGFVICDEPMNQEHSSVGFDGTNYLVAWYDWRPNDNQIFGSIYGTRVSPSGNVLDSPAFQIADRARGQIQPNVVCGGGDCLVVWNTDYLNDGTKFRLSDVWGRRVSSAGAIIDQQGIPIATAFGHQFGPVAGYGNERYLIAWSESTGRESRGAVYGQILQRQTVSQIHAEENYPGELATFNQSQRVWVPETAPIFYATTGVAFSPRNAYAFGYPSVYYQGNNWEVCASCPSGKIYGSWAHNPNNLWGGGWCRMLARYDGQNWSGGGCWTTYGTEDIVTGIWGSDATHIWATADRGDILQYDGSYNWATIHTGVPYDLSDLWGTSVSNIYAVGERGTILHYDGIRWNPIPGVPSYQRLNAIWGSAQNDIFVVGDWGEILHFNGAKWERMDSGTLNHLNDVWGISGSDVYAVGFNGTILHYDGTRWSTENSNVSFDLLSVWGVMGDCRLTIWAAGSGEQILRSETPTHCTFLPVVFRSSVY